MPVPPIFTRSAMPTAKKKKKREPNATRFATWHGVQEKTEPTPRSPVDGKKAHAERYDKKTDRTIGLFWILTNTVKIT